MPQLYEVKPLKNFSLKLYYRSSSAVRSVISMEWPIFRSPIPLDNIFNLVQKLEKNISLDVDKKLQIFSKTLIKYLAEEYLEMFREEQAEMLELFEDVDKKEGIYSLVVSSVHNWNSRIVPHLIVGPQTDVDAAKVTSRECIDKHSKKDKRDIHTKAVSDWKPVPRAWLSETGELRTVGVFNDLGEEIIRLTEDNLPLQMKLMRLHCGQFAGPCFDALVEKWQVHVLRMVEEGLTRGQAEIEAAKQLRLSAFLDDIRPKQ